MKKNLREELKPYLPENSSDLVAGWLTGYPLILRLSRGRKSKLGDYRPPVKDHYHRISVNRDLHPFEFLITLAHELAHLLVWEHHGRRAKPHGKYWKAEYSGLLSELVDKDIFPKHIETLLKSDMHQPKAHSKANAALARALHEYRPVQQGIFLEDLPQNAIFSLPDGRRFVKQEKLRTWYRCQRLDNRKTYRVNPVTLVIPILQE